MVRAVFQTWSRRLYLWGESGYVMAFQQYIKIHDSHEFPLLASVIKERGLAINLVWKLDFLQVSH